jgi:signal transduction histidine kinase
VRLLVLLALIGCDADTPERRAAADGHYRAGIEHLKTGNLQAAREELRRGTELAAIDPALYLPLARACRDRGLSQRAAEFYRKFLASEPPPSLAGQAAVELAAIDDLEPLLEERPWWPLALLPSLLLVAAGVWWGVQRNRRRGLTLARLCADNPELQPAIAYLVGCLRHELFKHRILAVGDAVRALARGETAAGQREFLSARLYAGGSLPLAWAGHLASFIRALGPRFDLSRHDPEWRGAARAVTEVARLEVALLREEADAPPRLFRAWSVLERFDRSLGDQLRAMTHTLVDTALLAEVVGAVRTEQPAAVEIVVGDVPPAVHVVVYRVDLVLVLKNLVRNAVRAAVRGPSPARVALDVQVALEATGEEVVRIRVQDTSPEPLPREVGARRDRGLGIVSEALDRYDGCLEVAAGEGPWQKSVSLRLFRALDDPALEAAA